jgi:hypothetical protein
VVDATALIFAAGRGIVAAICFSKQVIHCALLDEAALQSTSPDFLPVSIHPRRLALTNMDERPYRIWTDVSLYIIEQLG